MGHSKETHSIPRELRGEEGSQIDKCYLTSCCSCPRSCDMGLVLSTWLHKRAQSTPSPACVWSSLAFLKSARLAALLCSSAAHRPGHEYSRWSSVHHSPHFHLSPCKEEVTRAPTEQSSDGARAEMGVKSGLHVWELQWSPEQRGSHAVIGVSTKNCPLQASGYSVLMGGDSQSWGWELKTNQLWHDGKSRGCYPRKRNDEHFEQHVTDSVPSLNIPSKVLLALDADAGTLGFIVNGSFLGAAFEDLPHGVDLFPSISSVCGGATIRLHYVNGAKREPPTLMELCRLSICQNMMEHQSETDQLPLPPSLQYYLSSNLQQTE